MKANKGLALFLAATIVTSGIGIGSSVATAAPAQAAVSQSQVNTAVAQILKETNAARSKAGLKPLTISTTLNTIAQNWTKKMGDKNSLNHNPNFVDSYPDGWKAGGENIANGYKTNAVVTGWMNSPGHKANILDKNYTHIGIGYYVDAKGKTWFTQNFAGYPVVKAPKIISDFRASEWRNGFTAYWWWNDDAQDYKADLYLGSKLVRSVVTKETDLIMDGLVANTQYTLKVTARNFDLNKKLYASPVYTTKIKTTSSQKDPEYDMGPVSAPFPVTYLSADVYSQSEVGVQWDWPNDYNGYHTFNIVTLKSAGKANRVFKTTSNGLDLKGLVAGTSYTAVVQAQIVGYDLQETRLTPAKSVTFKTKADPNAVKVNAVTSLKASSVTDSTMVTSWKAPTGTVGKLGKYTVLINQGSKTVKRFTTSGTSYKVTGLSPGVPYIVTVIPQAFSSNGHKQALGKAVSSKFTTTKVGVAKVNKPAVKVSSSSSAVTATWTRPAFTGKFVNYTVTFKQGKKVVKTFNTTALKASFSKLKENTAYTVTVRANVISPNGKTKANSSSALNVKTKFTAASTVKAGKPASVKVSSGRTSVATSWKKPSVTGKLVNYTIVVKQGTKTVKSYTTTSTKRTITGLKKNTTYKVYVKTNAKSANSKYKASSAYVYKSIKTKR